MRRGELVRARRTQSQIGRRSRSSRRSKANFAEAHKTSVIIGSPTWSFRHKRVLFTLDGQRFLDTHNVSGVVKFTDIRPHTKYFDGRLASSFQRKHNRENGIGRTVWRFVFRGLLSYRDNVFDLVILNFSVRLIDLEQFKPRPLPRLLCAWPL